MNFRLSFLASIVSVGSLSAQTPRAAALGDTTLAARVDRYLASVEPFGAAGALLMAKDGRVVLEKGYGYADRETRHRFSPTTPVFIGSLGKQFTAAAILKLESEGKLHVEDSISRFLTGVPPDKAGITIHHLLTHTSGLPYLPAASLFAQAERRAVFAEMLALPLQFRPGERFAYSSPGYSLLAAIIERASGGSYEDYLRAALFRPAGLTSTRFLGESNRSPTEHVRSYSDETAEPALDDLPNFSRMVGPGNIVSTVQDLFAWELALRRGLVLSPEAVTKLFAPRVLVRGDTRYAYGWNVTDNVAGRVINHAGDIGGYNVDYVRYLASDLVVIFVSNSRIAGRGVREPVIDAIGRLIRGEDLVAPRLEPISGAEARRLERMHAGRYATPAGGVVVLWRAGDSLFLGAANRAGLRALAPVDSAGAVRAAAADARVGDLLAALGNTNALPGFLHPSIPPDLRPMLVARLDSAATDVLGSVVMSPIETRTYVRRRGRDGVVGISMINGRVIAAGFADVAHSQSLRLEAPTGLASFEFFRGVTTRFVPAADGGILKVSSDGASTTLTLRRQ